MIRRIPWAFLLWHCRVHNSAFSFSFCNLVCSKVFLNVPSHLPWCFEGYNSCYEPSEMTNKGYWLWYKFCRNDYYFSRKKASLRWYYRNNNSTDLVTIFLSIQEERSHNFWPTLPLCLSKEHDLRPLSFILPIVFSVSCSWSATGMHQGLVVPVSGVSEILGDIFKQVNFACHVEFTVCLLCQSFWHTWICVL